MQGFTRILTFACLAALLGACVSTPADPPTNAESVDARIERVHSAALVLDGHADIALPSTSAQYLGADGTSKVRLEKLEAGGVNTVVLSAAVGPGPRTAEADAEARSIVDAKIAEVVRRAEQNPERLVIATTPEEIQAAQRRGRIAALLSTQNARAWQGDIDNLDSLYEAGVRVFAFNHIGHNDFADSSRPVFDGDTGEYEIAEEHGGLSELGRAAVKRLNSLGALIDVSQTSKAGTLEIARRSQAPIVATHSNVRALSSVTRNLSDEEIDAIAANGGVIHIAVFGAYLVDLSDPVLLARIRDVRLAAGLPEAYAYPYELYWEIDDSAAKTEFLTTMRSVIGRGSVDRMIDHIDYLKDRVGIDHIGVGSDFNHGGGVVGFMEADEARGLTRGLIERGYSDTEIEQIWGGNFLRALAAAQAGRAE